MSWLNQYLREGPMYNFSKFTEGAGERHRLKLFHEVADTVPAYKDFLRKNKINPKNIKKETDLNGVPSMSKKNYLRLYPLSKLCLGGTLKDEGAVYTATSGSTGTPFYFPRNNIIDDQSSHWHELFLDNISGGKKVSTLVIDCFGMGVWIGGLITYQAFRKVAERGYPVSVITPGPLKQEIFHALKNIAANYQQVILCGYPPFIKDVIDEAEKEKIDIKKLNIKFLFAAEGFSEGFREYVSKKVGIKNLLLNTTNIYGSADLGTMAMETPLSILIRREALKNKKIFNAIFSNIRKTPTLAQFNPLFTDFEIENDPSTPLGSRNVLCSGNSVLPLFKYAIGDHGGVIKFKEMTSLFKREGIDLYKLAKKAGIKKILPLPFVYVYERADFSTKLYGAIIYPEHIKEALEHSLFNDMLTGKFTLETVHDEEHNEHLQIHIELKSDKQVDDEFSKKVCEEIVKALLSKNAEYADMAGKRSGHRPNLTFWPYEHPEYFKKGGKQKWVKKI
jgi:phenylacetate-CoA ligase